MDCMDQWSKETVNLYKRLICFHCFMENRTPKAASLHLNKTYGSKGTFLTEGAVKKLYAVFREREPPVDFNDFVKLQWVFRRPRRKPIPADPPPLDEVLEAELAVSEARAAEEKGAVKNKRVVTTYPVVSGGDGQTSTANPANQTPNSEGVDAQAIAGGEGGEPLSSGLLEANSICSTTTTCLDRCEKRKLILRCYKAKFSVGEANR